MPLGPRVAVPDVVDEHVEPALLGADARKQPLDLRLDRMVSADGDAVVIISAVSSIVSGRPAVAGRPLRLRPVQ